MQSRLNDAPVSTQMDGDFNVVVLMDAASGFILSMEFVPAAATGPSQPESKRLFKHTLSHGRPTDLSDLQ